jgi:hypothetical protein
MPHFGTAVAFGAIVTYVRIWHSNYLNSPLTHANSKIAEYEARNWCNCITQN